MQKEHNKKSATEENIKALDKMIELQNEIKKICENHI